MKARLMGIRRKMSFTAENTGELVEGCKIFYSYKDGQIDGQCCDSKFLRSDFALPAGMNPGVDIDMEFNPKGRLMSIEVLTGQQQTVK